MTQSETILKMIETVSPADHAKMDKIDALVFDYITENHRLEIIRGVKSFFLRNCGNFDDFINTIIKKELAPRYTRSRDVLKSIRPQWLVLRWLWDENSIACQPHLGGWNGDMVYACTEELAELHAIIQAIEHERTQ